MEIRKYDDGRYLEIESPGTFPEGITVENYLRKTNPRNPNVMDILREIGLAEKAGSGFDKIFTDLLKKGKSLPKPEETDNSVIFRIKADVVSEKLIELSLLYENQVGKGMKLDELNYQQITQSAPMFDEASSPLGTTGSFSYTRANGTIDIQFLKGTSYTVGTAN